MTMLRLRKGVAAGLLALACSSLAGCVNAVGGRYSAALSDETGVVKDFASNRMAPSDLPSRTSAPSGGSPTIITAGATTTSPPPVKLAIAQPTPAKVATALPATTSAPAAVLGMPNAFSSACVACSHRGQTELVLMASLTGPNGDCPRELDRVSLPPHKVAPSDILLIDLVRMALRPPYHVQPLETLVVTATDTLPGEPIGGPFVISPDGTINLGYSYGSVHVAGLTIDQVQSTVFTFLGRVLRNPRVTVALAQFRGFQAISGAHLVRPDGTISLGVYGSVYVAGRSLGQAKCVIEKHLSEHFLNPEISVDVFAYNSRRIVVIVDGGHLGQQVFPQDVTGNETVLDAISRVQGLASVSSKRRIWVARPAPGRHQIMPVDWRAITESGSTATNYQLLPGDRVFVAANSIIAFDYWLSNVLASVKRVLGMSSLATETISINRNGS